MGEGKKEENTEKQMNQKYMYEFLENQVKDQKNVLINPEKNVYIVANENKEQSKIDISMAAHPAACIWHFLFKTAAGVIYFIFPLLFSSKMSIYVTIILLCVIDFWIVKNVIGRLLVGLRWWSEPQPTGKDKWVFECKVDENSNNPVDSKIFWFVQITFTLGWLALAFYNIFTLDITDLITICIALGCIGTNLYAFFKCSRVQKNRVKDIIDDYKKKGVSIALDQLMRGSIKLPMNADKNL